MALVINDRVKETTTTTGTGAVAFGGAVTGFETFASGVGNSNTTYYAIVHQTANEFEVGLGTLDGDSSDLTRTTVISSSNSDSAVDFAAGTKDVFCTVPASKLVFEDASSNVTLNSTNKLLFRDAGLFINSSTDGQLDIVADSEIQIAATTIDINGAVALNGAITGATNITLSGELDAATLDISGNADIDGTLEADAITVDGTSLAEVISDTTGAMFSSNTETGITATYQDADNTIDLALSAAQTTITSLLATDIKIGEDDETKIDFEIADEIHFYANNVEQVYLGDNIFGPQSDSDVDLGSTGVRWKDAFVDTITATGEIDGASLDISGNADIDGTLEADAITVNGTALATVIAGTTVTNATNSAHVLVTDNESTNEENLIAFVEGATSSTGNVGLEMDGNFAYNPSTGTVSSTIFKGNIDAVDGDFDGTLEADAITIGGTAVGSIFSPIAGGTGILTTGALDAGSITSGFGTIDNGASNITNGGLVKLDVDSDADDVTGDSATGRLTIGAGEDLNLYHGGTNSYVVNDTGILVLQSAGGVVVNENSANVDFRVESNGDINMLIVDGSSNRVGMGVAAPSAPLHVFQAGDNNSTTELLLLETGSSSDGSGVKLRMATAHTSGIIEMIDGTGSFDSEFRFKLADTSQLATPADKLILTTKNAEFKTGAYNAEVALTDGSTVAWNASTAPIAKVTLGGNRTLGAATVPKTGQFISILFIQDGTGSRTISFNAAYEHTGDIAPVLTTTANKGDLFVYRYNGAKFLEVGRNLNLTLS